MKPLQISFSTVLSTLAIAAPSVAQITPDTSLPSGEQSIINVDGDRTQIQGGAQRGGNLFHSFEAFSIQQGGTAWFDNANDIQNIFSRITGSGASMIDGVLGANGSANLFFLNPNGILFGPNASLNIGGSFVAATANRVDFDDGLSWGLDSQPLLTIARPIGLEIGPSAGPIQVIDSGNTFFAVATPLTNLFPYSEANQAPGLSVAPGQTIALVSGSDIVLAGGLLRAPDGRVEIISSGPGAVGITSNLSGGLDLTRQVNANSGEIVLTQRALLDVTGERGGMVDITGGDIRVAESSLVITGALIDANPDTSGIRVAGNNLTIDGSIPPLSDEPFTSNPPSITQPPAGINSYAFAPTGMHGPIRIDVNQILLENGGGIRTYAFAGSQPSDIDIRAENLSLIGLSESLPLFPSIIATVSTLEADQSGGDINIAADQILIKDAAIIISGTTSSGDGGNIRIQGGDITLSTVTEPPQIGSNPGLAADIMGIYSATVPLEELPSQRQGSSGDITIETETLSITSESAANGISSTAIGLADAGRVEVRASESINIYASGPSTVGIGSAVSPPSEESLESIGVPSPGSAGRAGRVFVEAPQIHITRENSSALIGISASNVGKGNAGFVEIHGGLIVLRNGAALAALTASGQGGEVRVEADQLILLNGAINANAQGQGRGGNVDIQADFLALLDGASITANAVDDRGGRVFIQANAFLQSTDSVITATSALGPEFDGEVILEVPRNNPVTIIPFPTPAIEFPENIATCAGGRFAVTGRGGFPLSPDSYFTGNRGWNPPPDNSQSNLIDVTETHESKSDALPPRAQAMVVRPDGLVDLVAYAEAPPSTALLDCAQRPNS